MGGQLGKRRKKARKRRLAYISYSDAVESLKGLMKNDRRKMRAAGEKKEYEAMEEEEKEEEEEEEEEEEGARKAGRGLRTTFAFEWR